MTTPTKHQFLGQHAQIISIVDTKGGSTKITIVANIAAYYALAGLKTLIIDLDLGQPAASSYYSLSNETLGGVFEFLVVGETEPEKIISKTCIENLDLITSNCSREELASHLNSTADGIIRLSSRLNFIKNNYDVIIIDTIGTVDQTVSMAIMASDIVLSPIEPSMQGSREYLRGTLNNLVKGLHPFLSFGLKLLTQIYTFFNKIDLTNDCKRVKLMFTEQIETINNEYPQQFPIKIKALDQDIKSMANFKNASSLSQPAFFTYKEKNKDTEFSYKITKKQAQEVKECIFKICSEISSHFLPQLEDYFIVPITDFSE